MREDFGSVCLLVAGCVVALLAAVAVAAPRLRRPRPPSRTNPPSPPKKTPYEPTSHYTIMKMEGWKVYVNKALLPGGKHAEMGAKAIERLRGDMVLVKHWVADEPLAKLLKVGIWLEVDTTNGPHGRTPVFHYHSYLGWLKKMDFHPGKHKCVEYSRAASLVTEPPRQGHRARSSCTSWPTRTTTRFSRSMTRISWLPTSVPATGGKYPKNDFILRLDHKEFFAGVSTRYFGTNERTRSTCRARSDPAEETPEGLEQAQSLHGLPTAQGPGVQVRQAHQACPKNAVRAYVALHHHEDGGLEGLCE